MCELITGALAAAGLGGGAAATGAAAAATSGVTLAQVGTALAIGGSVAQGIAGYSASKAQVDALGVQRQTEAQLTASEDQRVRAQYRRQTRQQFAELASRGLALNSPMAIALGQRAGEELSFASQSVRAHGQARQQELSYAQQAAQANGVNSLLSGFSSAASVALTAGPEAWPELFS